MARLAIAAGGAAVGFFLGGPAGARIGLGLGLVAGNLLFPVTQKGPKPSPEDLQVSVTSYGAGIPYHVGTNVIAGRYDWLKGNQKDITSSTSGGKGAPEVKTFGQSATFGVTICEGPVEAITKVWFNSELVFDIDGDNFNKTIDLTFEEIIRTGFGQENSRNNLRFYLGTEDQLPDPDEEADRGVGNVSAYRGWVRLVAIDQPLEKFGNVLPNVRCKVITAGVSSFKTRDLPGQLPAATGLFRPYIDHRYPVPYIYSNSIDGINIPQLEVNRADTGLAVTARDMSPQLLGGLGADLEILSDGNQRLFMVNSFPTGSGGRMVVIDRQSLSVLAVTAPTPVFLPQIFDVATDLIGGRQRIIVGPSHSLGITSQLVAYDLPTGPIEAEPPASNTVGLAGRQVMVRFINFNLVVWCVDTNHLYIYSITDPETEGLPPIMDAGAVSDFDFSAHGTLQGATYWEDEDVLLVATSTGLLKVAVDTGVVIAKVDLVEANAYPAVRQGPVNGKVWVQTGTVAVKGPAEIDVMTMTLTGQQYQWSDWGSAPNSSFSYDITNGVFIGDVGPTQHRLYFLPRVESAKIPRATLLTQMAARAGAKVPDVSLVTGFETGYTSVNPTDWRTMLTDIAEIRFLDWLSFGGTVRFQPRDSAVVAIIPVDDLGFGEEAERDRLKETLKPRNEIPTGIGVRYIASDLEFDLGFQNVTAPDGVNAQGETVQVTTNLVMDKDEAAQAADIFGKVAVAEDPAFEWTTSFKHSALTPGDVINTGRSDPAAERVRIQRITGTFTRSFAGVRSVPSVYQSTAVGSVDDRPVDSIPRLATPQLLLIDSHALRDEDAEDGGFYAGVWPDGGSLPDGVTVYRSANGGAYEEFTTIGSTVTALVIQGAMPATGNPGLFQRTVTVTARLISGTVASVTEDDVLNTFANGFFCRSGDDWELVFIASITPLGNSLFELKTFVRGYRGTEFLINGSTDGAILIKADTNLLRLVDTNSINQKYEYVVIPIGVEFSDARPQSFTNTARGWRPYAVAHINGTRLPNEDLQIDHVRRSRLNGGWNDGTDVPLGETSEQYDYEVFEGVTLLRSVPGHTSTQLIYTLAMYQADSGNGGASVIPPLLVRIWQISENYGRGVPNEATL